MLPRPETESFRGKAAPSCALVIFGATGDLTKRLLLPSLCNLGHLGLLADNFVFVGIGSSKLSTDEFREHVRQSLLQFVKEDTVRQYGQKLIANTHFVSGSFDDPNTFLAVDSLLNKLEQQAGISKNRIYYLATPPNYFSPIVQHLNQANMVRETPDAFRRVVIEKPFGHDLASAIQLNNELSAILTEDQIFRIDHYLGKETVQNLLAFRFANGIFEPIWNRRYVDHMQITVAESLGVEKRGTYYDQTGAMCDMVPNHIFQLLSLIAMEPPISFDADAVRDEKAKVMRAIFKMDPEDVFTNCVRGQYEGYRSEPKVDPASNTETYAALKLAIDNWRWAGVPFYIRTGKKLANRVTEIAILFKTAPSVMFRKTLAKNLSPNLLVIHIQPEEGISLRFGAKIPGPIVRIGDVNMTFKYDDYFGSRPGTGYETLLYDCMVGDGTLFQRADMLLSAWQVVEPILNVWKSTPPARFPNYRPGCAGPDEADELLVRDGRQWRNI